MFKTERTANGELIYIFEPGERAFIWRNRYYPSVKTPSWANTLECEIIKNNERSVSAKIDGYGEDVYYVDKKDLVPTLKALRNEIKETNSRNEELGVTPVKDIDWYEDSTEVKERPIMLGDIIELNARIAQACTYLETCPENVQKFLRPVIIAASDLNCSLIYQMGFDDPNDLDLNGYKIFVMRDK